MTPTHRSHDMTDKLRDPLLAVMNLPTHRETLFGMAEGPALYEGQRLYLKRSEVLAELAAALAAAPQPAVADREACRAKQAEPDRGFDETPYDRGYVWGYRHGLRDGKAEVAPQPAVVDRGELVRLLQIITRNGSLDDGRTLHEVIADALLARGLRLPGGDETMAWAVQLPDGSLAQEWGNVTLWGSSVDAKSYARGECPEGGKPVRVAIRVVEGGDDE